MGAVRRTVALFGLFACLAVPASAVGQEPEAAADSEVSPVLVEPPMTESDTTRRGPAPMGAFFRSLVLPGWGQLATDRPGRAVFYATLEAATVYMIFQAQGRLNDAEEAGDEILIEERRNQREDWIALAVFWSLASAVDAWVGAHMYGFEVVPPPDGSAGLAVRYQVPVRGF